jgi:hypothetical protein
MTEIIETDGSQAVIVESAPTTEQIEDAGAEPAEETPEPIDEKATEPSGAEPVLSGAERRIKQLIAKHRQAEAETQYWKGVAEGRGKVEEIPRAPSVVPMTPDQFENYEDYTLAVARREARAEIQVEEARKAQEGIVQAHKERLDKARAKYEDFDEVALRKDLPLTEYIITAILESNMGAEIQYYLGSNIQETHRIVKLSPVSQVREIGQLEAKLLAKVQAPAIKKTISLAPEPVPTVTGQSSRITTDETAMSDSEWARKRNKEKYGR